MPRRRELKSVASGMATFSICRNNDVNGYWALGVLCREAENNEDLKVSLNIFSQEQGVGILAKCHTQKLIPEELNTKALV